MSEDGCSLCEGKMVLVRTIKVGDSDYNILKCEKCGHEVARSTD